MSQGAKQCRVSEVGPLTIATAYERKKNFLRSLNGRLTIVNTNLY